MFDVESSLLHHLAAGSESQLQVEEPQRLKFLISSLKDHLDLMKLKVNYLSTLNRFPFSSVFSA